MKTKSNALLAMSFVLLGNFAAAAGDLADGFRAYDAGHYAEAIAAWKRSAETGNTLAMTALADLYLQGEGVEVNPVLAVEWYHRGAARGDATAQLNLGDLHIRGVGVPRNLIEAYVWLGLAAAQGRTWAIRRHRALRESLSPSEIEEAEARIADAVSKGR